MTITRERTLLVVVVVDNLEQRLRAWWIIVYDCQLSGSTIWSNVRARPEIVDDRQRLSQRKPDPGCSRLFNP